MTRFISCSISMTAIWNCIADLDDVLHQLLGLVTGSCRPPVRPAAAATGWSPARGRSPVGAARHRASEPALTFARSCISKMFSSSSARSCMPLLAASNSPAGGKCRRTCRTASDCAGRCATLSSTDMLLEQADILERAGDAQLVGLHGVHARGVACRSSRIVPRRGLIHLGQQVEDGGLARAVRADQTGDFRLADGQVEILDGLSGRRNRCPGGAPPARGAYR